MASISVVIPTHNRAHVVVRAIESALAGAPADAEVIVVDDASSDATQEVVGALPDRRVIYERLHAKANGNVARNRGAAIARGPLLAFLDSDDVFMPGRLARLMRFFGESPGVDAVADGFVVISHGLAHSANVPSMTPRGDILERLLILHAMPLTCSAIALRRSAFEAIGGFDSGLERQQDRDLLLRLARGHRVALGTASDVVKHQSPDSLSRRAAGYVGGLEALVARHPGFRTAPNGDVLGYLSMRMILRSFFAGHPGVAARELVALSRSKNLPGPAIAMACYYKGRRERKRLAKAAMLTASGGVGPAES